MENQQSNSPTVPDHEQQFAALVAQVPPGELAQVLADLKHQVKMGQVEASIDA